ncbi:MAG: hydantoinase B/oxoprolinase family protein [Thermodesulfobacteriota bacterium]
MKLNLLELEIFKNQLSTIAEEMGTVLIRAAFSPNIKERRDLSCAIFNSEGEMIAQAAHIPVHLGSMSFSIKTVLEEEKIENGDIFILNDPFKGGTHLPDITCIAPLFIKGKMEFLVASRAHHGDVGGKTPGSMPLSTTIYEEGIIIPPTRIYKKGILNEALFNKIINQTRNPKEREGDFRAQISSLEIGRKRLLEIIEKYSASKIKAASMSLMNYSESITRAVIQDIPDGLYEFEDYLDDDGAGAENIPISVKIEIKGNSASLDFKGSSKKVNGCLNTPLSVTTAAVVYCFQCLAPSELPLNSGSLRAIKIIVDDDSILNAKYPSAVAGGNVETSQRVVDVVFGALSKAVPEKIQAASAGTMSNITFGGINPETRAEFTYYETIAGGMGGRLGFNGVNAVQTHMTNTLNTPIESIEKELPVMIESYSIKKNSGGHAKFNGGNGVVREYKFLNDSEVTLITERRKRTPWGINGGKNGKSGKNILISKNKNPKQLPAKCSIRVKNGDIVRIETPGGGGYGKHITCNS